MRSAPAGRLWFALLLLLSTLSSAPLGSMEQLVVQRSGRGVLAGSVPAARPSCSVRAVQLELDLHRADRAGPLLPPLPPRAAAYLRAAPGYPAQGGPGEAPVHARRVCERLPYDANAPPAVA